mmetsp:Transcript_52743/g.138321  ORF Transcript_52743/g.138321 Transcript_52743/m.138321 type:complete len:239 (+) Transcript_52743:109-825(+)
MAMAPIFDEAMDRVFNNWTTLALAVEQGWGGRDSRAKRNQLQEEVVEYLVAGSKRRRPPSHESRDDVETLATHLYTRLDELFNVEADDGSDEEVAHLCLRLFNTCRAGDLSFAEQFLQRCPTKPVDLSKSQGQNIMQYATEEDALMDQMQGMGLEDGLMDGGSDYAGSEDGMDADVAMGDGPPASEHAACSSEVLHEQPSSECPQGRGRGARPPPAEPVVDEDGFVSVTRGRRRGGAQ